MLGMLSAGYGFDGVVISKHGDVIFTPAQSVTVVDTRTRRFVGEIGAPGCALINPAGPRSFFSICSDGALLQVRLNDRGGAAALMRTPQLFDPNKDPLAQEGVRDGNVWWFTSFHG